MAPSNLQTCSLIHSSVALCHSFVELDCLSCLVLEYRRSWFVSHHIFTSPDNPSWPFRPFCSDRNAPPFLLGLQLVGSQSPEIHNPIPTTNLFYTYLFLFYRCSFPENLDKYTVPPIPFFIHLHRVRCPTKHSHSFMHMFKDTKASQFNCKMHPGAWPQNTLFIKSVLCYVRVGKRKV